ncbi:condensation domain-containing protein [Lachnospira pectinoschiza]|uniref:Condensation domain-containing protein n=1 Tax=Lachnospira pectinoschiza TaxID=28052 RepID=A0A1G9TAN3_9FIRM|nr:hypothetical protein [Lachnospira pectinoschiza]SDM44672.1 Condensation domain-containing protein [Lachnospira pectinoschiza]
MENFSLSDLQKSYLVGRKLKNNLGGVPCHAYFEFEGEKLDLERFKKAWAAVRKNHLMIHSCLLEDGEIREDKVMDKSLFVFNLSKLEDIKIEEVLMDCRENISHRAMDLKRGQSIGCELFLLKNEKIRICFDVDLVCTDVNGIQEILNELGYRYVNKDFRLRTYKLNKQNDETLPSQNLIKQDTKIPYGDNATSLYSCKYSSFDYKFNKEEYESLKKIFGRDLFATMLSTLWQASNREELLVNVPYFMQCKEGYDYVADNTKIFWMRIDKDCASAKSIEETVKKRLSEDRKDYKLENGLVPLVFSYNQNGIFLNEEFVNNIGKLTYMISQTPNVCLDVQLFNMLDGLLISFVYPKEINGIDNIKTWFENYIKRIQELIEK